VLAGLHLARELSQISPTFPHTATDNNRLQDKHNSPPRDFPTSPQAGVLKSYVLHEDSDEKL